MYSFCISVHERTVLRKSTYMTSTILKPNILFLQCSPLLLIAPVQCCILGSCNMLLFRSAEPQAHQTQRCALVPLPGPFRPLARLSYCQKSRIVLCWPYRTIYFLFWLRLSYWTVPDSSRQLGMKPHCQLVVSSDGTEQTMWFNWELRVLMQKSWTFLWAIIDRYHLHRCNSTHI